MFFNIHCDFDFDRSANARSFEFVFCVNAQNIVSCEYIFVFCIFVGEEDENKKRTMFLLSLREVAEKRDRKTCAANSFSCMNVLFIKIKIFVGIKFLEKGENVG